MDNLVVFEYNDTLVTDSREVAKMINKNHADLLRDIRTYCEYLGQSNFALSDFFLESTYISEQNKELPCYLLTRKGCDMVANKMTGEKGVLFTAAYVTVFHKMEEIQRKPQSIEDVMIRQLQEMKAVKEQQRLLERQQETTNKRVDEAARQMNNIKDIVSHNADSSTDDLHRLVSKIAQARGDTHQTVYAEIYNALESRARCDLKTRQNNAKNRAAREGMTKTQVNKISRLVIVKSDPRLTEIFLAITKEMAVKHSVRFDNLITLAV